MIDLFIGIDPAYRVSGNAIAVFSKSKNTIFLGNFANLTDFVCYLDKLVKCKSETKKIIFIENSLLQSGSFKPLKGLHISSVFDRGVSVGKNQGVSDLLFEICKNVLFPSDIVRAISPKEKGAKLTTTNELRNFAANFDIYPTIELMANNKTITQDALDAAKIAILAHVSYKHAEAFVCAPESNDTIENSIQNFNLLKVSYDTVVF